MLLSVSVVPRIPATTIRREQLERWLGAHAGAPVRLLLAPAGSGKTSLLLKYAMHAQGKVAYYALPPGSTPEELTAGIARAIGAHDAPGSYQALLTLLANAACEPLEIIVDDAGDGMEETTQYLHRLVEDVAEGITLIYAARCGDRINSSRLISRGIAEASDAQRLRFDERDAQLLAEACSVAATSRDIARLIAKTDGWALALSSTIRTAAAEHDDLEAAYDRWRSDSQHFLHEFVEAELARVPADEAALFRKLLAGGETDEWRLRALQARGLHIVHDADGSLRPYHTLRNKAWKHSRKERDGTDAPLMSIKMFGAFEAKIGGREIPWVRKRDQQIVKYLMLKPNGRATRAELRDAFWSGTDHHLAIQNMRTAFSTIRRAIAAVVGYDQIESYFRTGPDVHLVLDHVVCDVRRFSAHISEAEASFERDDFKDAAFHYRAADKLYAGPLLEFDGDESWFAAHALAMEERHLLALERLSEIAMESRNHLEAREYAMRAARSSPDRSGVAALLRRTGAATAHRVQTSMTKGILERAVASASLERATEA